MKSRSVCLIACLTACLVAPDGAGAAAGPVDGDVALRLRERVAALTDARLAGRAAGSPGGRAAAETLSAWFAKEGLQPAFGADWKQEFPLGGTGWTGDSLVGRTGSNVAGVLAGAGALAGRWLVLAAHRDHLGELSPGTAGPAGPAPDGYYPGANDNASGVAITHEVAGRLASLQDAAGAEGRRSLLVLNADGEEAGLQGATWLAEHPTVPLDSIDAMINLDTVGLLWDGRLIVSGVGTAAPLESAVMAAGRAAGVTVNPSRGGWSGSDHMVFNAREVPVLFLFGGPYPQYNRPADTADILDYAAMARVAAFTASLVKELEGVPGRFAWQAVAGGAQAEGTESPSPGAGGGNRQTWLGTMPDFSEGPAGYRLGGVFDGSPAAAAGLEKGDLLVRFGDYAVSDLATFTTALRAYAPGDLVEIGIVRAGRDLSFTVALGDRAQRR